MDMLTYLKNIIDLSPFVGSDAVSGVRYNPLKLDKAAFEKHFPAPMHPAAYFEGGYRLQGDSAGLGHHPLHMAGGCYFQEPSAMSAVTALQVQNGDKVLDLCAAPGSKATALAAANPDGIMVANEIHPSRAKILVSNMERMGIANALITRSDASALADAFGSYFDKILVDAPCSGEGMFRKYPDILTHWTEEMVEMCAARSREILESAARMLRPGGRLVYSTCTFNLQENEQNVLDFLDAHPEFSVVEHHIPQAEPGRMGLERAARIFPGEQGEGHFVCALEKREDAPENNVKINYFTEKKESLAQVRQLIGQCVKMPLGFYGKERGFILKEIGQNVYVIPDDLPCPKGIYILRAGVQAVQYKGKTPVPCQHLYTATPTERFVHHVTVDEQGAAAFSEERCFPAPTRGLPPYCGKGCASVSAKGWTQILKIIFRKDFEYDH